MTEKYVVRFAPSPTGGMHIGGIRTALYNYAIVKRYGGKFILRIEDTDQKRFVGGATEEILELLDIYGLKPDVFPSKNQVDQMSNKPIVTSDWILDEEKTLAIDDKQFDDIYIQTLRLPLYHKYSLQLIKNGYAYCCFRTEEDLLNLKKKAEEKGQHKIQLGPEYTFEEAKKKISNGEKFVVRLDIEAYAKKENTKVIKHTCGVMGELEFPVAEVSDQVLIKSDGIPTYHIAVVVDDHLMRITHPIRGAEWIPSTPKQVAIYKGLGWDMPQFFHVSAILDPTGGKLSKRKGSVAAKEFLVNGFLPEAVDNFLMLLGWSSPEKHSFGETEREIFSLQDFVELFDLKDLNKANPVFNREKLIWFNQKYISGLTIDQLVIRFTTWLKKYSQNEELKDRIVELGPDLLAGSLKLTQERAKTLLELEDLIKPFYTPESKVKFEEIKQTKNLEKKIIKTIIENFVKELDKQNNLSKWGHENWEATVRKMAEELNIKAGQAFMVLRLAILRAEFSPPLFESMEVLGKDEVIKRLKEMI